ncbi:MAG: hypothetical protein IT449_02135 [Phycisphaerales bacterium]|nr:hypothetical protein [Phycisphaerales bacterium]
MTIQHDSTAAACGLNELHSTDPEIHIRRSRRRRILLVVAALLAALVTYILIPGRMHRESQGWVCDISYRKYGCRFCLSHVDELRGPSGSVVIPQLLNSGDRGRDVYLATPVGTFFSIPSWGQWHIWHSDFQITEIADSVSPSELAQGYYHLELVEAFSDGWARKSDTPSDWCMMSFSDTRGLWWVSPEQANHFGRIVLDAGMATAPEEDAP